MTPAGPSVPPAPPPPPLSRELSRSRVDRKASGPFPLQPSAHLPRGSPGPIVGLQQSPRGHTWKSRLFLGASAFSAPAQLSPSFHTLLLPSEAWGFSIRFKTVVAGWRAGLKPQHRMRGLQVGSEKQRSEGKTGRDQA